jgi:hypothetical protein
MFKTASGPPPGWNNIVNEMLKFPTLDPKAREFISSPAKLNWSPQPPSDKADARAFVSTEDVNNDGTIDKINIVMTNINKDIPPDILGRLGSIQPDDPMLTELAKSFAEIITHEVAHIKSYDPSKGEFVGGEPVAEAAGESFIRSLGSVEIISRLSKIANKMDSLGLPEIADKIDEILLEIK